MSNTDPEAMLADIWDQLKSATSQARHPFRWPALATVSPDQLPQNRIVVLRAVEAHELLIFTDARTRKVSDLKAVPHASLLFFDSDKLLQLRISGEACVHIGDEITKRHWADLSSDRQAEYQAVDAPGSTLSGNASRHDSNLKDKYFAIVRLQAQQIDRLQITREAHLRHRATRNGTEWTMERIVP